MGVGSRRREDHGPRAPAAPLAWFLAAVFTAGALVDAQTLDLRTPAPPVPEGYALVVGVAQYPLLDEDLQLQYAERDAESMYRTLISAEGGNFRAENVRMLIGAEATGEAIQAELSGWLAGVARPEDRVVVYFAGHGFVADGVAFLAPYDFDPAAPAATGYAMSDLAEVFGNQIRARWKVLLTDACHSGAIAPPEDREVLNQTLQQLGASVFSLTAGRGRESSLESSVWGGGHGVFTYYVLRGMEGEADRNRDGRVTADELSEYVRVNVERDTEGRQHPTSDQASFDPNMLLAYLPAVAIDSGQTGRLIIGTNMDGVEIYVDGERVGTAGRNAPLAIDLSEGEHALRAERLGYEPVERTELVSPGREASVTMNMLIPARPR